MLVAESANMAPHIGITERLMRGRMALLLELVLDRLAIEIPAGAGKFIGSRPDLIDEPQGDLQAAIEVSCC